MVVIERIWDRTTLFVNNHLSSVLRIAIGTIFVPYSINGALRTTATDDPGSAPLVSIVMLVATLVLFWGQASLTAYALTPGTGYRLGLRQGARALPRVLVVVLCLLIVIGIAVLPAAIALAASGFDFQAAAAGRQQAMAGGPGMLFAGVYGLAFGLALLVLAARLLPLYPVVLAERRTIGALARAWQLTRGATWKLIGVLLLYLVVSGVAGTATGSVFGLLLRLIAPTSSPLGVASVLTATLVAAVQTAFDVLAVVFCVELYRWTSTSAPTSTLP